MEKRPRFAHSPLPDLFLSAGILGLTLVVLIGIRLNGGAVSLALKDPATAAGEPVYLGAVSNAGAALLIVAATAALMAAVTGTREARLFKLVALLTGTMAYDDLFLLHEGPIRDVLPWFEIFLFSLYGVLALTILAMMGRTLLQARQLPIVVGIVCMAVSVILDIAFPEFPIKIGFEELSKFTGFLLWSIYWSRRSLDVVRQETAARADPV